MILLVELFTPVLIGAGIYALVMLVAHVLSSFFTDLFGVINNGP